ncbi:MAG: hypothetical protein A3D44_00735 [Candidatus Staskawiczbacteria bacterium RIFCSPHIGHO2_02_FULL_42_22]|uniref:Peptidase S49 domain-containing protein n=1 Tax=Candidatus Staskawiczbacteria bacterium RIFCSPHIGHO2_02_FULL_42_22 TaxID=1802207 RepID=A0A1G2I0X2_9BACT|nr:MAG: hypothetical protein A3D44_00735 [Candidatus Staskawiczbacteria bacterium RIFCSPHIGHO2_02_FULL_42_22]
MNEKIKKILKIAVIVFVILTALAYWGEKALNFAAEDDSFAEICYPDENVAVISIEGEIVSYIKNPDSEEAMSDDLVSAGYIVSQLNNARDDENIKAVILEIDSYGGSPVGSEEIMNAVKRLNKPSIALIREGGVSGAYLIASVANRVFASEISDIGSIGVTASYLDYSQQDKKDGITYNQLSSGKFKDTGDPDKSLTAEEKELIMRDIKISHEFFVKKVAENRKLDIEKVKKLADGSTMLGMAAKENGLIDEIGGTGEVKTWITGKLGIEPTFCYY